MRWSDLLATSSRSLSRNKSRSILTVLGIVIGIAAVIWMVSIGQSAQGLILSQVADLGSDSIFVEPSSGDNTSGPPDPFVEQSLDLGDAQALERSGLYVDVAPIVLQSIAVSHEESNMFAQVVGVTPGYLTVFPADVAEGRYLDDEDVSGYARIAVLGSEAAQDLFGDQSPIGRTIKIKQTFLRVVGVLESQGSRFFQNLDARIAIPITTAQRDVFGVDYVSFIAMRSASGMNVDYAKEEARWILRDQHNIENPADDPNQDDFTISTQADAINVIGAVGGALTILLSSIAAISLLVGGIGIMNIMLVSVTERTKEIGLRKAVGATQKEILQQFLLEAVMLTGLGGFIGVALGVGVALISGAVVATQVDGWRAVVPLSGVVLAVVVSVAVGLTFGLYPARRAARLDPVEALRYE